MLHPKLSRVLKVIYSHSVVFALMGTTLKIRSYKKSIRLDKLSWTYITYSLFISTYMLSNSYFMVPQEFLDGYIKNNIILRCSFSLMVGLGFMEMASCYGTIWLKRQEIIQFYKNSLNYWTRFKILMKTTVNKQELKDLQLSLASRMRREIMVLYGGFVFSTVVQYQLVSVLNNRTILAFGARITHMLHFVAVKMGFYTILILLEHQFKVIHLALHFIEKEQNRKQWKILSSIASFHLETLQLARKIFRVYDISNATLFINMFTSTINILYHAVQFGNESIQHDGWGALFGNGLIIFNIWGTLMLLNTLERAVSSCNYTGEQLKQFNDLPITSKNFQRELDKFATHLRNNRLVYKIVGLVELNKPAGLSYIASIFTNLIILMQFDLRLPQQQNIH
ncbi:putative gustatory receptor 58b [Drosophila ficusphila]|uniref:putative gustatory receptor 58b n=1 Tax=Drosophila ficusphila TaxID=30025 RepID=UPI0007E7FB43|nr:putative gustatory receptor 58b [Drosophila ficusphila]